ncbi:hypothetical protein CLAFUW4_13600 [Fulvia fulva]|uniref:Uncharacterized protein n=1 Tax=Passalora fulva TaxID=5499 RepID=A0A9Q8PLJ6_PASFU|nr:uncharacterized protein CLAFUR5_13452 [Fulvia fulva]KAK4610589.1 hypothetical protein CLAFUR4_13603 [Fulvia fulva]KAK4611204.1 hypothetical protein CLAFUR0_13608 [Fulvia fulva]UJO24650.1 hypothetical protein CLAFUR5_13452 [Fulvia fulva]WPV22279.1 hypothetical protein CLAFUW4_13600 [Fulvia fulva]WPV37049.1 hypothetical protein CLAFUW7_13608 [Fulvia fulva]
MSVRLVEPSLVRARSVASRGRPAFLDRIEDDRFSRVRSHSQSLVHVDHKGRTLRDIDEEIRALEAQREREREAEIYERKAFRDEQRAAEEYRLASRLREPPLHDAYELRERSRSRFRANDVDVYDNSLTRRSGSCHRDELVVYDRYGHPTYYKKEKSPPRNVVRVEKDRKGRMSLVRSAR